MLFRSCHESRSRTENQPGTTGVAWFDDVTEKVGLNFVHDVGPVDDYPMPATVGSGAALFDYDNDGRLDIYLIQNAGPNSHSTNRLFHQEVDGRFTDVSKGSGLDVAGYGMGEAIGDMNNDGWPDLLVTEYTGVRLFINNGNGTFTDITNDAGLDNPFWAVSAAFFDYHRDGWLDLVVVNYIDHDPSNHCSDENGKPDFCGPKAARSGTVTKLFRNLGPVAGAQPRRVRFEDVTVSSGFGQASGPGLGILCADFDGDGWPDVLVANDGKPNHLWMNKHDGTFREEAVVRGVGYNGVGRAQGNMGIAVGDVDGDGLFDLYVTHLIDENNILWAQGPRGTFRDHTIKARLSSPQWQGTGFGTVLADFDHDGALDLAVVNGHIRRSTFTKVDTATVAAIGPFWSRYAQRNQLFANDGTGHFRDVSAQDKSFCSSARVYRGLVCGDIFNDGSQSLLATCIAGPARLFRNVAKKHGHWLMIRATDPALGGRDAYGAEVVVAAGERRWLRLINPGYSYASSNDPRAHFGLGDFTRVESIEITWPDGEREKFVPDGVDRLLVLRKGKGSKLAGK